MGQRHSRGYLPDAIAAELDCGATVVTANRRSARSLRLEYDQHKRDAGEPYWQQPSIFSWDAWLASLWQGAVISGHASEMLLSAPQEHKVWRSILEEAPGQASVLRSSDSLAELASDAWRLINQYNGRQRLIHSRSPSEAKTFLGWVIEFERLCRVHQWLSKSELESALIKLGSPEMFGFSKNLALVGFDEFTPAQQGLIKWIKEGGVEVKEITSPKLAEIRSAVQVKEFSEEILAAARWASSTLLKAPEAKIGIIVPELETRRAAINRIFRRVLTPDRNSIYASNQSTVYEFSVGMKLSDTPYACVALDILHWCIADLPLERASSLMISPLLAMEPNEINRRAIFDAHELRKAKLLRPEISLKWMIDRVSRGRRGIQLPRLQGALVQLDLTAKRYSLSGSSRSPSEWSEIIRKLLHTAQCGRTSGEDSVEFQVRKRWDSTLDELAALGFDGSRMEFNAALRLFEKLVSKTTFAPEGKNTPVQILGPLESTGSTFDAIWFAGTGNLSWPTPRTINPLLPLSLQAELNVPGANLQLEEARNRRMVQRIASSANELIVSHAEDIEATKQRPSSVFDLLHLSAVSTDAISPTETANPILRLEAFSDDPLATVPSRTISGGSDILKLQAACGFRAFAEKRLFSSGLEAIDLGMDVAERGTIVHRAMEAFWNSVKTQSALRAMTSQQLRSALDQAVDYGLRRANSLADSSWDYAYLHVQKRRLMTLLATWIDIELKRESFEVKLSEKEFSDVPIGPLRLNIRVDRVDETQDGYVLVDYKTGNAKSSEWFGDRPDSPQLPLYAVSSKTLQPDIQVADVAFANIYAGNKAVFDSLKQRITTTAPPKQRGTDLSVSEQIDQWQMVLNDLAEQFFRGDTAVSPKKYPMTCRYCAQRTLCRLDPTAIDFEEGLDDQASDDEYNG